MMGGENGTLQPSWHNEPRGALILPSGHHEVPVGCQSAMSNLLVTRGQKVGAMSREYDGGRERNFAAFLAQRAARRIDPALGSPRGSSGLSISHVEPPGDRRAEGGRHVARV